MDDQPIGLVFAFFFAGAMLRGQATYWLARIVTEQGLKRVPRRGGRLERLRGWLESERVDRGRRIVDRWGWLAIAGCYLTVGIQSIVIAAAGIVRMRWLVFTAAQVIGALAWATIYTTVGFAAWTAFLLAELESPLGIAAIVALALAAGVGIAVAVRRRRRGEASKRRSAAAAVADAPAETAGSLTRKSHDGVVPGRTTERSAPGEPEGTPPRRSP